MHISQTLDVVDAEVMRLSLPFLRKRSQIVEVVSCESFIFVLTHNGLCAAFTAQGRRLGLLNVEHDEVVRSLFYNKTNRSIISVSVFNRDKYSSLHCRSTALTHFSLGTGAAAGFPIFISENLQWPGFVEFDDVNSRVLTYNAATLTYRVWDLRTYVEIFRWVQLRLREGRGQCRRCRRCACTSCHTFSNTFAVFSASATPTLRKSKSAPALCCLCTLGRPDIHFFP